MIHFTTFKAWNEEGTWSEFSRCDKSCGGGMQFRTRAPHKITGETCSSGNMELRSCNTHKCIGNPGKFSFNYSEY